MQQVSRGGLAIAQQIAHVYQGHPAVATVMVSGSVARGIADHYSDLEIGVFWHTPPSDQARQEAITALNGELWSFTPSVSEPTSIVSEHYGLHSVSIQDHTYAGLVMIDTKHATVAGVDTVLRDVLEDNDTNAAKHILLAAIVDGIPLVGTPLLTAWQARARTYPLSLAVKVIQEHFWFGPWFIPQAYIERDDRLVFYQHIIWMQQNLLHVLAGLNRVYYPSAEYKWMEATVDSFSIKPTNLSARLKQILQADPAVSIKDMMNLINETILLVEQHCPEVNQLPMFEDHPEITTTWAQQRWLPRSPYSLLTIVGVALEL